LIREEVKRYWIKNNPSNFQNILIKFIQRLMVRGHALESLAPLLTQAANNLDLKSFTHCREKKSSKTLYIRLPYHPKGLQNANFHIHTEKPQGYTDACSAATTVYHLHPRSYHISLCSRSEYHWNSTL